MFEKGLINEEVINYTKFGIFAHWKSALTIELKIRIPDNNTRERLNMNHKQLMTHMPDLFSKPPPVRDRYLGSFD